MSSRLGIAGIVLLAAFGLAACGGGGGSGTAPDPEPTGPTQAELDAEKKRADDAEKKLKDAEDAQKLAEAKALFKVLMNGTGLPTSNASMTVKATYGQDAVVEVDLDTNVAPGEVAPSMSDVQTDIGMPTPTPFAEVVNVNAQGVVENATLMIAANAKHIASLKFAGLNVITHENNAKLNVGGTETDVVQHRGTYMGADGTYTCTGTCTSQRNADGSVTLSAGWIFTPDSGEMVAVPDGNYIYWGWWAIADTVSKLPTHADAFYGANGTGVKYGDATTVTGKATYSGGAVGKYAMSDVQGGTDTGGHWTANAILDVDFDADITGGTGTDGTISGTISGFMSDGQAMPWVVELQSTALTAGSSDAPHFSMDTAGTVWKINGRDSGAAGSWQGAFYNSLKARNDGAPTSAAGSFTAKTGTNEGHMIGAFGVHNDVPDTPTK